MELGHYALDTVHGMAVGMYVYGAERPVCPSLQDWARWSQAISSLYDWPSLAFFLYLRWCGSLSPLPDPVCITTKLLLLPPWQWPICRVLNAIFVKMAPSPTSNAGLRGNLPSLSSLLLKGKGSGVCFQPRREFQDILLSLNAFHKVPVW